MTPQSLSPEEVNERVARKLGWQKHRRNCEQPTPGASIFTYGNHWYKSGYICREIIPNYSGRIEAAWEIVDKVRDGGPFYLHWVSDGYASGHWWCSIVREYSVCDCDDGHDTETNNYEAKADTAPMAICLAFLRLP